MQTSLGQIGPIVNNSIHRRVCGNAVEMAISANAIRSCATVEVNIRRTRQNLFVVTAFMQSFPPFSRLDPINRVTTNGFGECLPVEKGPGDRRVKNKGQDASRRDDRRASFLAPL